MSLRIKMAKKRKAKIQLSKVDGDRAVPLSVEDRNTLPPYHHFVDAPDQSYRLFFEEPHPEDEIQDLARPKKVFARKKSRRNPFRIVGDGVALVGEDIAKTLAILLSIKILSKSVTNKSLQKHHCAINNFFIYLSELVNSPNSFSEINEYLVSGWLNNIGSESTTAYKMILLSLFEFHPHTQNLDVSSIRIYKKRDKQTKALNEIDFDEIVKTNDYSEKIHFQLLAYVYFEIELAEEGIDTFENASVSVAAVISIFFSPPP